jgi:hypothetical protein
MGFVAAGAEDGSAQGQDSGKSGMIQIDPAILNQAAEAIAKSNHFHAIVAVRGLADTADSGIQARTVATGGEDADALDLFSHLTTLSDTARLNDNLESQRQNDNLEGLRRSGCETLGRVKPGDWLARPYLWARDSAGKLVEPLFRRGRVSFQKGEFAMLQNRNVESLFCDGVRGGA